MSDAEHITNDHAPRSRRGVEPTGAGVPAAVDQDVFTELAGVCELWPVAVDRRPRLFTPDSLREIDRLAVAVYGLPTIVLMENAGAAIAVHAKALLAFDATHAAATSFSAVIVAGKGNNAGDGFVVARHLTSAGWKVAIVLAVPTNEYRADAAVNLAICQRMNIPIFEAFTEGTSDGVLPGRAADAFARACERVCGAHGTDRSLHLVVDALLGTGLRGPATGCINDLIVSINEARTPRDGTQPPPRVLSIDIPSGLDAATGEPPSHGNAVYADLTVSLVGVKPGFLSLGAQRYLGRVVVCDIGLPAELLERFAAPDQSASRPGDRAARTDTPERSYRPGE